MRQVSYNLAFPPKRESLALVFYCRQGFNDRYAAADVDIKEGKGREEELHERVCKCFVEDVKDDGKANGSSTPRRRAAASAYSLYAPSPAPQLAGRSVGEAPWALRAAQSAAVISFGVGPHTSGMSCRVLTLTPLT